MPEPTRTPNPATGTQPERSSQRVAHKKAPLAWLPLAALALLALLALLIYLLVRGASGSDDTAAPKAIPASPGAAAPSEAGAPSAASPVPGAGSTGTGTAGSGGAAAAGGAGTPIHTTGALVGGAGLAPVAAAGAAGSGGGSAGGAGAGVAAAAPGTAGTVLFAEGKAAVDADGRQVVTAAAKNLTAGGAKSVQVIGYTDKVAGAPINGPLSEQRAQAVATELKALLPAGTAVTVSAKGQADPAASNATAAGRQQNRRVTIIGTR